MTLTTDQGSLGFSSAFCVFQILCHIFFQFLYLWTPLSVWTPSSTFLSASASFDCYVFVSFPFSFLCLWISLPAFLPVLVSLNPFVNFFFQYWFTKPSYTNYLPFFFSSIQLSWPGTCWVSSIIGSSGLSSLSRLQYFVEGAPSQVSWTGWEVCVLFLRFLAVPAK